MQNQCPSLAHIYGQPCFDCHQEACQTRDELRQQAEHVRRETQAGPPACLQIPLPNLEALASLPF